MNETLPSVVSRARGPRSSEPSGRVASNRPTAGLKFGTVVTPDRMPTVELDEETIERLDSLRVDDESYDEIVNELINIYEAEELTLFHSG